MAVYCFRVKYVDSNRWYLADRKHEMKGFFNEKREALYGRWFKAFGYEPEVIEITGVIPVAELHREIEDIRRPMPPAPEAREVHSS